MRLETALARLPPPGSALEGRIRLGPLPDGAVTFAGLAQGGADLARLVAAQKTQARGGDDRLGSAYLIGSLSWETGMLFGGLWLAGWHLHTADPAALAVTLRAEPWASGGETGTAQVIDLLVDPAGLADGPTDPAALAGAFAALHAGIVTALPGLTGLGAAAHWRQVSDSFTGAILERGKGMGRTDEALALGRAALADRGTRLWSKQGGYARVTAPPDLSDWFRLRSGCCRFYTSDGGEYCTTCVHRTDDDRIARLRAHLIETARATQG